MGSSILAAEVSTIDQRVADHVVVRQRNPTVSPSNHASPVRLGDPTDFSKLQLSSVLEDMSNSLIRGSVVDEGTLDLVEILEKLLLRQRSVVIKESHRSAYCWMAVECTLRFMWPSSPSEVFTDAVERIWTKRIGVLKENGSGLVSGELLKWEIDLKKAAEDPEMYERIRKSNVRYNAMSSLNQLLGEQGALPGSSSSPGSDGVCNREDPNDVDENIRRLESENIGGEDGNRDVGGVGSVEDDGSGEHAEEEEPTVGRQEQEHEPSLVKMAAREVKKDYLLKPNHSVDVITPRPLRVTRSRTRRQDLIEITPARVNASEKGSGSRRTRSRSVPLKKPRRIKNYWMSKEVEALREGVQKYGTSWKSIKNAYPAVLAKRTQVDLKDKWRNLPDSQ